MESELLYSKERLALERKGQQHLKPVTEDSTGAAWAHMRRRLFRAEREARVMRRLTMGLFCISLAGAAGVITMAPPWSEAIESRGSAGQAQEPGTRAAGESGVGGPRTRAAGGSG